MSAMKQPKTRVMVVLCSLVVITILAYHFIVVKSTLLEPHYAEELTVDDGDATEKRIVQEVEESREDIGQEVNVAADENNKRNQRLRRRHLPQCIIIGSKKSGTTALKLYLSMHPNIVAAAGEVHFFDQSEIYAKELASYKNSMPYTSDSQITIEKTPSYFVHPKVPDRVHRMNPDIKLLLIVRDPVNRAISDYVHIRTTTNNSMGSFENETYDYKTESLRVSQHIRPSLYSIHMSNWLRVFDLRQFLVIDGDDFIRNPVSHLRRTESFLGIPHYFTPSMFYMNNTRGFICVEKTKICLSSHKGRPHPTVDSKVMTAMRAFFAPYNLEFYKQVNHDFNWSAK